MESQGAIIEALLTHMLTEGRRNKQLYIFDKYLTYSNRNTRYRVEVPYVIGGEHYALRIHSEQLSNYVIVLNCVLFHMSCPGGVKDQHAVLSGQMRCDIEFYFDMLGNASYKHTKHLRLDECSGVAGNLEEVRKLYLLYRLKGDISDQLDK